MKTEQKQSLGHLYNPSPTTKWNKLSKYRSYLCDPYNGKHNECIPREDNRSSIQHCDCPCHKPIFPICLKYPKKKFF